MFAYHLRLSLLSLRRNPGLSLLSVGAIALGIAVATALVNCYYLLARDPMPGKSDKLFYIRMDSWEAGHSYSRNHPERPPDQVTYRDAMALAASDIPTHHTPSYRAVLFVHPEDASEQPYAEQTRLCMTDFFAMFDVPFAYGGPWDERADEGPEPVVVIDDNTNRRLFGGENSVGRQIKIGQQQFRVAGVLAPWRPLLKFYDTHNDENDPPEALYLPFRWSREMLIFNAGNTSSWKSYGPTFTDKMESEAVWIQYWAQLDSDGQRQRYQTFLDGYTDSQRSGDRFQRPNNNWVQPMPDWLTEQGVVPPESRTLAVVGLLFLLACAVNLVGLLLGKFLSRAPEIGVRRALGATRRSIFLQHLVECQLVGLLGGAAGVVLSIATIALLNRLFGGHPPFFLDWRMIFVGLLLAQVASWLAGAYPAWRICAIAPARHLKTQ